MATNHLCKDCGQEMEAKEQPMLNQAPVTIATCQNRACTLWSVTLTTDVWNTITDEKLTDYRKMVANLKATITKRGGAF